MTPATVRRLIVFSILLRGGAACEAGPVPATDSPADIVVTAPRGTTIGGIGPLLELGSAELDPYGADTMSDLVDALRPLTRSSRSDQQPVVLINGHLAGTTEFDNLPREAIERVEVLPESVALQYGFSENQRVLNFVLKEHYRAVPVRAGESGATEGGSQVVSSEASLVHLGDEARVTVLGSDKHSAWLRESDRGIVSADSVDRTLQPARNEAKIATTVSRSLPGVSLSVEASYAAASARSLQGVVDPGGATPGGGQSLVQSAPINTTRVAAQLTSQWHGFVWGATAFYLHSGTRSTSDTGVDAAGTLLADRTRSGFDAGNAQFSTSGRIASLPAGPVIANIKLAVQYQGFDTQVEVAGTAPTHADLVRTIRTGSINAALPLTNRAAGVLAGMGDMSATFNAALDDVSSFGTLVSTSYGLEWEPAAGIHLDAIYTDHRTAPTVQQLRAPPVLTPNVQTFDFITGATVYVTQVNGGDPGLSSTDGRQAIVGMSLGPYWGRTTFVAHVERSRIRNGIGALPPATRDVEQAFPDRFIRAADGTLTAVDNRWVNFENQSVDDLKWGVNVWLPLGDAAARSMPNRIEMSLFDTWYLHDVTLIRRGVPPLDLLGGAPSDLTGGQPRHKIEFHTLYHENGLGVLLAAAWRSATVVGDSATAAAPLNFSSLGTADLRVFADLEHLKPTRNAAWARGARISLAVTNLSDRRQRVHDATGETPAAFLPGYLDPPGRTISLTARKVF